MIFHKHLKLVPVLFADDTNLFFSHRNISILIDELDYAIWFRANKLSLDIKKCNHTLFSGNKHNCYYM